VHGLTVTLFERLQKALGLEPLLLDMQYRMNPAISGFPSKRFYQVCMHFPAVY
jgi:superfamily I DNA and/or RNA helicase